MLIKEKLGNLTSFADEGREIDPLPLEWHECSKRILHKRTNAGREVVLKFLGEAQNLQQDDVLYADDGLMIVVEVLACEVIVLKPTTPYQMAYASYEIGNKHLPLFFENDVLLLPYDAPVYRQFIAAGFAPKIEKRKLLHQFRTTITAHTHLRSNKETLFSKILKLTTPAPNE